MDEKGRTKLLAWVFGGILLFILFNVIVVPLLFSSGRAARMRSGTYLRELSTAEADFRANDRDWNHVNDFWTGDVKGLYTMTSAAFPGVDGDPRDVPIKLISLSLASSDADEGMVPAGGENTPLSKYVLPGPASSYWHAALIADETGERYRQDTAGTPPMGACHHPTKFAFIEWSQFSERNEVNIVNESNVVHRIRLKEPLPAPGKGRWGIGILPPAYRNWPSEEALKTTWELPD